MSGVNLITHQQHLQGGDTLLEFLKKIFKKDCKPLQFAVAEDITLADKARYAQQLLDNPLFSEIFSAIENELTETWKNSPASDIEGREFTYLRLEALRKFRLMLEGYIAEHLYEEKLKEQKEALDGRPDA